MPRLSLDYMRLAGSAAAAAFSQDQALMLLPPTIVETGLRGLALDGGIVVDPSPLDPRVTLLTEAAVEMLLARLDGTEVEAPQYLPATLRLRPSTGSR